MLLYMYVYDGTQHVLTYMLCTVLHVCKYSLRQEGKSITISANLCNIQYITQYNNSV